VYDAIAADRGIAVIGQDEDVSTREPDSMEQLVALAQRAVDRVLADVRRTTSWRPTVLVDVWMGNSVRISVDGGFTAPSMSASTEPESIAEVADYVQEQLDQNPSIWPVCGVHDVGLHAEVRDGRPVWWCRLGGRAVNLIGELDPANCAP
jgi:hypothetical protein